MDRLRLRVRWDEPLQAFGGGDHFGLDEFRRRLHQFWQRVLGVVELFLESFHRNRCFWGFFIFGKFRRLGDRDQQTAVVAFELGTGLHQLCQLLFPFLAVGLRLQLVSALVKLLLHQLQLNLHALLLPLAHGQLLDEPLYSVLLVQDHLLVVALQRLGALFGVLDLSQHELLLVLHFFDELGVVSDVLVQLRVLDSERLVLGFKPLFLCGQYSFGRLQLFQGRVLLGANELAVHQLVICMLHVYVLLLVLRLVRGKVLLKRFDLLGQQIQALLLLALVLGLGVQQLLQRLVLG